MLVPYAKNATVDIRKLRDYCLNLEHDEGKHKARLFVSIFGVEAKDADALRLILLEIVQTHHAELQRRDAFGQRYTVDFMLEWNGNQALVRSGWILEHDSIMPRLTTCYPL